MSYTKLPILFVAITLIALPLGAGAISSTSYQMDPTTFGASTKSITSTTYQMDAIVDVAGGRETSSSFVLEAGGTSRYYCGDGFRDPAETCDGTDLNSATCASQGFETGTLSCSSSCAYVTSSCITSSGGGGGGGGGGTPSSTSAPDEPVVSSEIADLDFTYKSPLLLYGSMDKDTDELTVNDKTDNVKLVDEDSWQVSVSLAYGLNSFELVASEGSKSSDATIYEIYRRLIGDVKQDDTVNDYDLSKLVKLWGDDSREGDFNEDGTVDDYDFSMMVARWGTSV
ncbi:TPA: hypothetical protein DCW61_04500 [Candidatus Uhrbacteria bacterium]|nr:hypothetical protein [Candidatus Uhrbacteria bacterium]